MAKRKCKALEMCNGNPVCLALMRVVGLGCKLIRGTICLTKFVVKTAVRIPCKIISSVAKEV